MLPETLCSGDSQGTIGNKAMDRIQWREVEEQEEVYAGYPNISMFGCFLQVLFCEAS